MKLTSQKKRKSKKKYRKVKQTVLLKEEQVCLQSMEENFEKSEHISVKHFIKDRVLEANSCVGDRIVAKRENIDDDLELQPKCLGSYENVAGMSHVHFPLKLEARSCGILYSGRI